MTFKITDSSSSRMVPATDRITMTAKRPVTLLIVCLLLSALTVSAQDESAQSEPARNPHARWESAIRRFEEADLDNPQPRQAILFVGSSSIRFWNLKKWFPEERAINHGFGGSQIDDTIHFADRIVWPFAPKVIVFYAGDNDVAAGKSADVVSSDFREFAKLVDQHLPDTRLIYIAIKPSLARWKLADEMKLANAAIAEQCASDDRFVFLDIWTPMLGDDGRPRPGLFVKDGLHLNATGYELWSQLVNEELKQLTDETTASATVPDE